MRAKIPQKPFGRPSQRAPSKPKGSRLSIRPATLYLGFAGLLLTNVLTLVGFLMAPDISNLLAGQNGAVLGAYEDRISQLRLEVDRLQSRHYAQTGDINLQLQELAQTQEVLTEQHQYVKQLADKAAALGIDAGSPPKPSAADAPAPLASPDASASADAPADSDSTLLTGSIAASSDAATQVAAAAASVNKMLDDSHLALAALSDEASSKTDRIMGALAGIGIRPKLPTPADDEDAMGGPLLPPVEGADTPSIVDDANIVANALDRYKSARDAAALAPVHLPVAPDTRISSIFGNRKDPFTGRLAFHPGLDFAAPEGSTVLSAGAGTVSFVGQISGYGNVVEVNHGNGLVTLYGHLSAFLVTQGQTVDTGSPLAKVGSTGRSTGPHLHFEVRRADTAVDPAGYLGAGRILQTILAG